MLRKGPGCVGCPMYGTGDGFVPDEIRDVPVLVLAQNPGAQEEVGERVIGYDYVRGRRIPLTATNPSGPAPLIGPTGFDLVQEYLPLAGLTRAEVSLANVLKCRAIVNGKRTNDLPPRSAL